jgi:hypothetical protein
MKLSDSAVNRLWKRFIKTRKVAEKKLIVVTTVKGLFARKQRIKADKKPRSVLILRKITGKEKRYELSAFRA